MAKISTTQAVPEHHKWLVPGEGSLVRDPRSKQFLPAEGYFKPWIGPEGRYWRRRLACGDVTEGTPPQVEKPAPAFKLGAKAEKRED